nr:hypothetical protein [Candidatus Omnitrophota bacterium]
MKKFNRSVSFVVLAAFLVNSIFTDLAFSQISSDKLATASRFGDLLGPQGQDMARIRFILAGHIAGARDGDGIDLPRLIENVSTYRDSKEVDKAPVEFEPLQVFGHEMTPLPSNLMYVMCRLRHRFLGVQTYYAVFPRAWEGAGFPIEVYTDKEWSENKIYEFLADSYMPKRSDYHPGIAQAIERDVAHQGFDSVLQWAHDPANADYIRPVTSIGMDYEATILHITTRLTGFGVKILGADGRSILPLSARKSSIVVVAGPVKERLARNMVSLRSIDGTPLDIVPSAHLSNNYLNTLLTPQDIRTLSKGGKNADRIKDDITARWVHEVGVSVGLPVIFFDGLRPVNIFDLLWKHNGDWDSVRAELDSRKIDALSAGFRADSVYRMQDLDTNIETRDAASGYGMGEDETPQAKDLLPAKLLSELNIAGAAEIKVMPIGVRYKIVVTGASKVSVLGPEERIIIRNVDAFNGYHISPNGKYLMVRDVNMNASVINLETLENMLPNVQDWGSEYPFGADSGSVTVTDRALRKWRYDFGTKKWTKVAEQGIELAANAVPVANQAAAAPASPVAGDGKVSAAAPVAEDTNAGSD